MIEIEVYARDIHEFVNDLKTFDTWDNIEFISPDNFDSWEFCRSGEEQLFFLGILKCRSIGDVFMCKARAPTLVYKEISNPSPSLSESEAPEAGSGL